MKRRQGFTLVELLVVIAIIGVLIALLLPAVQAAREAARRSSCSNKLKQMALAMHNYHDVNRELPEGASPAPTATSSYGTGGWKYWLLPYLEQVNMFQTPIMKNWRQTQTGGPVVSPWEDFRTDVYQCPSDANPDTRKSSQCSGTCYESESHDYVGISGANPDPLGRTNVFYANGSYGPNCTTGLLVGGRQSFGFSDCTDGTSNTMIIAEQTGNPNYAIKSDNMTSWTGGHDATRTVDYCNSNWCNAPLRTGIIVVTGAPNPVSPPAYSNGASRSQIPITSFHPTGANVVLTDGSVRFLSDTTDALTCRLLAVKDDGAVIGEW